MHFCNFRLILIVSVLVPVTVWSKRLNVEQNYGRVRKSTCIFYQDSIHSESAKSSQSIKIIEKSDANLNIDNIEDSDPQSDGFAKVYDVYDAWKYNLQFSDKNKNLQIIWLFPKREKSFEFYNTNCEVNPLELKSSNFIIECNNTKAIFHPICGFNGKEYVTFYNICEYKKVNECQERINNRNKWEIVSILKCVSKNKITFIKGDESQLKNISPKEKHSEISIEDLVKEKVESFKLPDAKDPTKEAMIVQNNEYRQENIT